MKLLRKCCKNPDSILDSVDTGFGSENKLNLDCPKPEYHTHLCKENYLGEFKAESEKILARTNLGVYSIGEVDKIVSDIVKDNITRNEVQSMIANLDFVDSTLKSHVDYQIPNNLFKL